MNPHRRRAAGLLLLSLSSCSSNASAPTGQQGPVGEQDIGDVIYVGGVTDEALVRLLALTPKSDARHAVIVDSPDLTAPLAKDSAAMFQFHLADQQTRAPGHRVRPTAPPVSIWVRSFRELVQFSSPERIAHAHGTPYNGLAYYLEITDADSKPRLQVFTTATSFTPEAVDWQNLVQAPQPLSLEITSAIFEDNSIRADGGPYLGGVFPFRIE